VNVRWLLVKDLQILRRSPFLVAVLVAYPIAVALLIGFALSRGPDRPTVAFLNEVPANEELMIGGQRVNVLGDPKQVFKRVDAIEVGSRREAEQKVRSGEALGALIVPSDTVTKLQTQLERPQVDVLVNEEDPLKGRLVDDTISSLLADANQRLSRAFTRVNLNYLRLLVSGGTIDVLGRSFEVLGLRRSAQVIRAARDRLPARSIERRRLNRVVRFYGLAQQNFNLPNKALAAISEPLRIHKQVLNGAKVPLTTFAAAISVAVSLMFVTVLLAAAALALERDENAFGRLVRGPVTRTALLVEKILLAGACAVVVTLVLLGVLSAFVSLEWHRFPLWLAGLVLGAAAFAAMGTAIGGVAREVPTASLLAVTLLLPVAFLALVPSGVVSATVYDVTRAVSALFPFKPTLSAMNSALYGNGSLLGPLAHLAGLALAYAAIGRLALARFA
jgi:ABC-type multidrug transport system permease subunit